MDLTLLTTVWPPLLLSLFCNTDLSFMLGSTNKLLLEFVRWVVWVALLGGLLSVWWLAGLWLTCNVVTQVYPLFGLERASPSIFSEHTLSFLCFFEATWGGACLYGPIICSFRHFRYSILSKNEGILHVFGLVGSLCFSRGFLVNVVRSSLEGGNSYLVACFGTFSEGSLV